MHPRRKAADYKFTLCDAISEALLYQLKTKCRDPPVVKPVVVTKLRADVVATSCRDKARAKDLRHMRNVMEKRRQIHAWYFKERREIKPLTDKKTKEERKHNPDRVSRNDLSPAKLHPYLARWVEEALRKEGVDPHTVFLSDKQLKELPRATIRMVTRHVVSKLPS